MTPSSGWPGASVTFWSGRDTWIPRPCGHTRVPKSLSLAQEPLFLCSRPGSLVDRIGALGLKPEWVEPSFLSPSSAWPQGLWAPMGSEVPRALGAPGDRCHALSYAKPTGSAGLGLRRKASWEAGDRDGLAGRLEGSLLRGHGSGPLGAQHSYVAGAANRHLCVRFAPSRCTRECASVHSSFRLSWALRPCWHSWSPGHGLLGQLGNWAVFLRPLLRLSRGG